MKRLILLPILMIVAQQAWSHCEIPCGIYDDSVRVALIKEHIETIEKSMIQINTISGQKSPNMNQLVRWVNNKEEHAAKIQHIVAQYFMHQRIKVVSASDRHNYGHYTQKLVLLHQLQVYAMKAKQTTDVEKL
jgi:nickel superoxide dismutase